MADYKIVTWNPEKGFGFADVDGQRVFVHISRMGVDPWSAGPEPLTAKEVKVGDVLVNVKIDEKNPRGPSVRRSLNVSAEERRHAFLAKERQAESERGLAIIERQKSDLLAAQERSRPEFEAEVRKALELVKSGGFSEDGEKILVTCSYAVPDPLVEEVKAAVTGGAIKIKDSTVGVWDVEVRRAGMFAALFYSVRSDQAGVVVRDERRRFGLGKA